MTWSVALKRGISVVTGHHHTKQLVREEFVPSLNKTIFAAQVGTLINNRSAAFDYNKTTPEDPKLGVLIIRDGFPHLIPMIVDHLGRWDGTVL